MRSVTFDGDAYDPSGSLSGGSKPSTSGILVRMKSLKSMRQEFENLRVNLERATADLKAFLAEKDEFIKIKQALELKVHSLGLLDAQLKGNTSTQCVLLFENMQKEHLQLESSIKELNNAIDLSSKRQEAIKKDMDEFSLHKDKKLSSLQTDLCKLKNEISRAGPSILETQRDIDIKNEECKQLKNEISSLKQQLDTLKCVVEECILSEKECKHELSLAKV